MNGKISEQILKSVSEKTGTDKIMKAFIQEILFEELEHPGIWWFKDRYKKKVKRYCSKWKENNEDS